MFSVEKTSKLKFKPPGFSCDSCIHTQIEDPLPKTPFFMAIIGSAGSGKTSMMVNLLTSPQAFKKVYHSVHVIMPSHSVASLKKNIFARHDKMYDELDWETLDKISEAIREDGAEKNNSLLVLDDVTASLKDRDIQHMLKDLIYNRRHYRLSIMILVQSYNAMPLPIRKTLSHFVGFKPRNKKEYSAIFDELIFLDRDVADKLQRFVFDEPYTFMFVCVDTNKIHKNFDSVHIKDG